MGSSPAPSPLDRVHDLLTFLYGETVADEMQPAFAAVMARTRANLQSKAPLAELTEQDALLIAYGDSIHAAGERPLQSLRRFLSEELGESISGVHILPFYPYTSDDGFSVVDYRMIDPALGTWEDVAAISSDRRVMFDAVVNHISQASAWFQGFLRREMPWRDYFISVDPAQDLSMVVRPRTLPLLTPVEAADGVHHLWTTFSADQIDLNFANPQVALEIADLLLFYAEQGASLIRLDAIAYLWKEPGTRSIHLPQTHAVVKLLRAVLDGAAPNVLLITETNVPHADNISYFGAPLPVEALPEGVAPPRSDEAQLVYQFSLAPLILHSFAVGDASVLTKWANELEETPGAFFNFTASHDGIGVLPALGYLTGEEVLHLATRAEKHGGRISYRSLPDGSQTPYELNITFFDALNDPAEASEWDIARFLASQAIMLSLAGMPGIYFQSLFGARNCTACLEATGRARSINREKFAFDELVQRLHTMGSREQRVYRGYKQLLEARRQCKAFHPLAPQKVLSLHEQVFVVLRHTARWDTEDGQAVLCLTNVTGTDCEVILPDDLAAMSWRDLLTDGGRTAASAPARVAERGTALAPYQTIWLQNGE